MIKKIKILFSLVILSIFFGCSKEYEVPNDVVVHDFVWKGLNAYYLYQNQIDDLSDRRFNSDAELNTFLRSFTTYNDVFEALTLQTDVKSRVIDDYNTITTPPLRTSFTNGVEYGIVAEPGSTENVLGYVISVLPNSDASTKNISRGEFFYAVDGIQLTRSNYQVILQNGATNFTINMANFNGTTITPNGKNVILVKQNYTHKPIFLEKTFSLGTNTIGYLMYNNDYSINYIANLNDSFLNFKNQSVNQLILDFRYNIGGGSFAKNISKLASMITGQFTDEILIKEEWNSKAQPWFLANQPDSLITKFTDKLDTNTNINSLNLTDVYIILNGDNFEGSSALELLINSLQPYINVQIIGNTTSGNNTGSITIYNSEDYDFALRNQTHTVALQPLVLSFLNKNDQTYINGFTPNITLCTDENILTLGVLGERSDPILDRVLNYINTGNLGVNPICNPNNLEFLFHSINSQRTADRGVFIDQDLPNTN